MGWVRRGLLLLAFVFAVLGVHPCDSAPGDRAADHAAHHALQHPTQHPMQHAGHAAPAQHDDGGDDCMGGACDVTTREFVAEPDAPAVVAGEFPALSPSPLGSLAPGLSDGYLHSGRSPGHRVHAPTLLTVLRT